MKRKRKEHSESLLVKHKEKPQQCAISFESIASFERPLVESLKSVYVNGAVLPFVFD